MSQSPAAFERLQDGKLREPMLNRTWTLLGSCCISEHRILRIREDRYRFEPTGAEAVFVVCDSSDWTIAIPVTEDGRVVFVRQYRHGVRQSVLEVPGGVAEPGETPEATAARELREETGFTAKRLEYLGKLLPNPALNNAHLHVVLAEGCSRTEEPRPDPFEQIEVELYRQEDLPEMIRSGQLCHAQVIGALALWNQRLGGMP